MQGSFWSKPRFPACHRNESADHIQSVLSLAPALRGQSAELIKLLMRGGKPTQFPKQLLSMCWSGHLWSSKLFVLASGERTQRIQVKARSCLHPKQILDLNWPADMVRPFSLREEVGCILLPCLFLDMKGRCAFLLLPALALCTFLLTGTQAQIQKAPKEETRVFTVAPRRKGMRGLLCSSLHYLDLSFGDCSAGPRELQKNHRKEMPNYTA